MINSQRLEGIKSLSAKTMRRYFQILGLALLALSAGGWGVTVAAVLCPHAQSRTVFNSVDAESAGAGEACHSVKPEPVKLRPHCHDSGASGEAGASDEAATTPNVVPDVARDGNALALPQDAPCTHCLSRPEEAPSSPVMARQQSEQKRGFEPQALLPVMPVNLTPSFAKPVLYRQGAPPGVSKPKHLLIGLLLI